MVDKKISSINNEMLVLFAYVRLGYIQRAKPKSQSAEVHQMETITTYKRLLNACAVYKCVYVFFSSFSLSVCLILLPEWVSCTHIPSQRAPFTEIFFSLFIVGDRFLSVGYNLDSCSSFPGIHRHNHITHTNNIFTSTPTMIPSHMRASKLLILYNSMLLFFFIYIHTFHFDSLGFCSFNSEVHKSFFDRIKNRTNFLNKLKYWLLLREKKLFRLYYLCLFLLFIFFFVCSWNERASSDLLKSVCECECMCVCARVGERYTSLEMQLYLQRKRTIVNLLINNILLINNRLYDSAFISYSKHSVSCKYEKSSNNNNNRNSSRNTNERGKKVISKQNIGVAPQTTHGVTTENTWWS